MHLFIFIDSDGEDTECNDDAIYEWKRATQEPNNATIKTLTQIVKDMNMYQYIK
jgi:hypothetical protein